MMKETKTGVYTRNGEDFSFNFYTDLSSANKLKFVNSVVDLIVDDRHYNYVIKDLVTDFYIIDIFSDYDTSDLKSSSFFVNDVENLLEETNIVDIIKANMKDGLLEELNKAVDNSIEYLTGIHTSPLNDALSSLVNALEKKINEIDLDSMMEMVNVFSGMTGEFTPESIVNAYMNSDIHKKNIVELEEAKKRKSKIIEDANNDGK